MRRSPDKHVAASVLLVGKASNLLWGGFGLLALLSSKGTIYSLTISSPRSVFLSTVVLCDSDRRGVYASMCLTRSDLGSEVNGGFYYSPDKNCF